MTISNINVRAVAFGSCFVRRLILGTTDDFQQVTTVYDYNNIIEQTDYTPLAGFHDTFFRDYVALPVDDILPGGAYYIQCKYQNGRMSCPGCPVTPVVVRYSTLMLSDSVTTSFGTFTSKHFTIGYR